MTICEAVYRGHDGEIDPPIPCPNDGALSIVVGCVHEHVRTYVVCRVCAGTAPTDGVCEECLPSHKCAIRVKEATSR